MTDARHVWRDMASSPRDGTPFLLRFRNPVNLGSYGSMTGVVVAEAYESWWGYNGSPAAHRYPFEADVFGWMPFPSMDQEEPLP